MGCPLPRYWMCHIAVALIIMGGVSVIAFVLGLVFALGDAGRNVVAGGSAGIAFYAGREYTQWENLGYVDWKGLIAPIIACLVVFIVCVLFL